MELKNTIILSANNPGASQELTALLQQKDILAVVIFGNEPLAEITVDMADIRADGIVSGIVRKAVWMQDPGLFPLLTTLITDGPDLIIDSIFPNKHNGIAISMEV
jgi:hypothetical protein